MDNTDKEIEEKWTKYASDHLVGKTIIGVRYLSTAEANEMHWYERPVILYLSDGSMIFPSRDDEGNGGGALFGQKADGKDFGCPVLR